MIFFFFSDQLTNNLNWLEQTEVFFIMEISKSYYECKETNA